MAGLRGEWKTSAMFLALVSAAAVAAEPGGVAEATFLHVPLSMLYVAIGGTLFGVFLLPNKDASRVSFELGANTGVARRLLYLMLNAGALAIAVLGFAFLSAWSVQAVFALLSASKEAMMPITGITGVLIRPLLPSYLRGAEALGARLFGKVSP